VLYRRHQEYRQRVLQPVRRATTISSIGVTLSSSNTDVSSTAPALYVLNAAAIKPHAVEQLAADLNGYKTDVAVITETHLKKKHVDHHFTIDGYALFRRDRVGRRGGGVAVYVNNRLTANVWTSPGDSAQFELLWVRVQAQKRSVFIGALYHPPKTEIPAISAARLHWG